MQDVLHVSVPPVLCFVDNVVPPEGELLGSVRAVSLEDLLALLTGPSGVPIDDVDSVVRLARTLTTPTPRPAPPRREPTSEEPSRPSPRRSGGASRGPNRTRTARPTSPRQKRRTSSRSKGKQPENGLFRAVAEILALFLIAAIGNSLQEAGDTTTTPPLDGPTVDTPTPFVGMGVVCRQRGAGYTVRLQWPTTLPTPKPVAFEVASVTEGITIEDELWTGRHDPAESPGVWPSTEVKVIVQGIAEDGTRLAPTASLRTTPDAPC